MMRVLSDDELITRSLRDSECFEEVFQRWWPPISSYLIARLGREEGLDAASEVFVRAFKQRSRFDPRGGDASGWLYGFAANLVHERRRRERRQLRALTRTVHNTESPAPSDPELGPAMRTLARMPLATRETVLLWVWADQSHEQIAAALGISPGTVASRISRFRRKLTEALPDQHGTCEASYA